MLQSTNLDDKYFILLLQVYFSNEYFPAPFFAWIHRKFLAGRRKVCRNSNLQTAQGARGCNFALSFRTNLLFGCNFALVSFRTNLLFAFWETYVLKAGRTETVPETPIYIHMSKSDIRKLPGEIARIFFCMSHFFGNLDF